MVIAGLLPLVQVVSYADIIPADRITSWGGNVGVEGGIPDRSTIFRTLTPTNTLQDINSAIAACPSNQVVSLATGTYFLNGQIVFNGQNGVTLRGAGPASTILRFTGSPAWGNILVQGANIYGALLNGTYAGLADWTGGYTQGGSNLTLSSVSGLVVGMVICLDQVNDNIDVTAYGWEGLCNYCGRATGGRSQQQWAEVRAIAGNTVTIWPPVYMPNWRSSQSPQVFWLAGFSEMCGIENLKVDGTASSPGDPGGANIALAGTWNCWVRNVRSDNARESHVEIYGGGRCEVRHCCFFGTQSSASLSYGIVPIYASANLLQDNIFNQVTTPLILASCVSGTVLAYNYCTNMYYTSSPGWMMEAMFSHDAHNCMNLFEGNYADGAFADFYHGSSSHNTVFRNRMTGYEPGKTSDTYCLSLMITNHYWNAVGNVLGTGGYHTHYEATVGGPWYDSAIYQIGWNNSGFAGFTNDPVTVSTFYRHGNYDVVNNGIVWNSTNSDHNIPTSLYLSGKPTWFGDRPWPPVDPAYPSAAAVTNLPAGYRFVFGVDPPAVNVTVRPPVAVVSATPQAGAAQLGVSFSSAGSYNPQGVALTYNWSFGDGLSSTAANPSHTYQGPGIYGAQLTVSDGISTVVSRVLNITVTNRAGGQ